MSDDAALRERALLVLGVLDRRDSVTAWNASHPAHPKGPDGKWAHTAGMPDELVSIAVKVLGGTVTTGARHDREGLAVLGANGRSVELDDRERRRLRSQIIKAQYDDDGYAGADGVYRVVRETETESGIRSEILVSLRPVEGAYVTSGGKKVSSPDDPSVPEHEEVFNSEFDMVVGESPDGDFADEPSTRVSLDELFFSRNSIHDSLERVADARRVETGNGLVDVFSPRPGAVVLRTEEVDKDPNEILLNARDVRRIDSAISDVLYGEGEDVEDLSLPRDAQTTIQTSHGAVEVRFKGRRDEDGDWAGVLTILRPNDEAWGVAVDGSFIDEFTDAFGLNGSVAGILERQADPASEVRYSHGGRVPRAQLRAVVAREVQALLHERAFDESKVKRDRKGRFAEKSAAAILDELDEMMKKLRALSKHLDDDEKSDLDNALDYLKDVHRSKKRTVDAGGPTYFDIDSEQYHSLQLQSYADGDISVEHDEGELTFTPEEAEEIAEAIDDFRGQIPATPVPGKVAEKTTSSGNYVVALWGTGDIEVGPPEFFEPSNSDDDDEEDEIVTLVIGPSEGATAVAIADALEELAETGVKMKEELAEAVAKRSASARHSRTPAEPR